MRPKALLPTLILAAGFGLVLAAAASAQPWPRDGEPGGGLWERLASRLDTDQDGRITEDEFNTEVFAALDADGDGVLTPGDVSGRRDRGRFPGGPGGPGAFAARIIARLANVDGNREVTRAEWDDFVAKLDADGNGTVSAEEWAAVRPERPETSPRPEHAGPGHFDIIARGLDRDGDARIGQEDLAVVFDELDADGGGTIEADEIYRHRGGHRRW